MSDNTLVEAADLLNSGATIKEVVDKFNVSLDKAKKISQIANMTKVISTSEPNLQEKFKDLGYKALVLNPLFKEKDIDGIKEILESIDSNIKRDDLKLLPEALKLKRDRLAEAKRDAEYKMSYLKETEKEIEGKIVELQESKKKIDESMGFLNDIEDKKTKEFLMEHLGVAKGKIVLYKRLDIAWQQTLKQLGAIRYNQATFTWEIIDIDKLNKQTERRIKNKNNMYYDPDKATGMFAHRYPDDPVYKNAIGLGYSLLEEVRKTEKELKELKKKKREINKSLKELKGTKVQTYMEAAEVSNHLSEYEIIDHRRLQNAGMRYLYNAEQVAITEVAEENYRFDVVGYNQDGQITIIEAKASIADFRSDDKFHKYTHYCNNMYFIFEKDIYKWYESEICNKIKDYNIGVLVETKDSAVIMNESGCWSINEDMKNSLIYKVNRMLSRKFIYGR